MSLDNFSSEVLKNYVRRLGKKISQTPFDRLFRPIKGPLKKIFPIPKTVMISVTDKCQARCQHCGMEMYEPESGCELSEYEVKLLIQQAAKLGSDWIYFFGGEPLLRPDLMGLIQHAGSLQLKTRLDSNGLLLSRKMVKNLKQAGLDRIGVSIDSADPEEHDLLRGLPGIFEKAVKGIKYCINEGLYCYITTYVTKKSIQNDQLAALVKLAKSLKVDSIRVLYAVCSGHWLNRPAMRLSREEKDSFLVSLDTDFVFLESLTGDKAKEEYCSSLLKTFIYVSFYGEVQPCPYVPLSFGNVRSEALGKILERMWKHPIFNLDPVECLMNNDLFREQYLPEMSKSELPLKIEKY